VGGCHRSGVEDSDRFAAQLGCNLVSFMLLGSCIVSTCAPLGDAVNSAAGDHLLRSRTDRAKMWVAPFEETPDQRGVMFPKDRDGDLLRLKRVTTQQASESRPVLTEDEIMALPKTLQDVFVNKDGSLATKRAVIGDPRNDENLFISQLHLAFLRLHNAFVDAFPNPRKAGDSDKVFAWAKEQVQLHYQWLVANVYLPSICDPVALGQVIEGEAAMYRNFVKACDVQAHNHRPMPLEFSLAAFRMGHSMVRGAYDWNKFFGRSEGESILPDAPFGEMFRFTGSGGLGGADRLVRIWGADWSRLVMRPTRFADLAARRIDTQLAPPLKVMRNEGNDTNASADKNTRQKNLIDRNLRRGTRMNVASAQACIASLERDLNVKIDRLTKDELRSGRTGRAVQQGGFDDATPLWFYVLKEAEVMGGGDRLGPLGTHLVAGTLMGLLMTDTDSAWNTPGSIDGKWHPVDGAQPNGELVDSFAGMVRAAGLMATAQI
jgi:hypothetical protein